MRFSSSVRRPLSGGSAHLRQHLADGLDGAGDAALPELSHAPDAEGFESRQLARIEYVAAPLDRVIEGLEGVAWAIRRIESHDDRCLDRRGEEAPQTELRHPFYEGAAVARVTRVARGEAAFLEILRDGRVECRHDVRRRRVAPLCSFLHVH